MRAQNANQCVVRSQKCAKRDARAQVEGVGARKKAQTAVQRESATQASGAKGRLVADSGHRRVSFYVDYVAEISSHAITRRNKCGRASVS